MPWIVRVNCRRRHRRLCSIFLRDGEMLYITYYIPFLFPCTWNIWLRRRKKKWRRVSHSLGHQPVCLGTQSYGWAAAARALVGRKSNVDPFVLLMRTRMQCTIRIQRNFIFTQNSVRARILLHIQVCSTRIRAMPLGNHNNLTSL